MFFVVQSVSLKHSADDLAFTIDKKSLRAIRDSISIGNCGIILKEDGGRNMMFFFVFHYILLFFFGRHLEKDQLRVLELFAKFSKRRRLPLAIRSPRCEKVQQNDLPSQLFEGDLPSTQLL